MFILFTGLLVSGFSSSAFILESCSNFGDQRICLRVLCTVIAECV